MKQNCQKTILEHSVLAEHQTSQSSNGPSEKNANVGPRFYNMSRNKKPNSWDVLGYNKKLHGCYFYLFGCAWVFTGACGQHTGFPAQGPLSSCGSWVGLVMQVSLPASQDVGS